MVECMDEQERFRARHIGLTTPELISKLRHDNDIEREAKLTTLIIQSAGVEVSSETTPPGPSPAILRDCK